MKQEEKDLLLKDLCARLPYGVKAHIVSREADRNVYVTEDNICHVVNGWWKECKPYLFPLSSMTEEQEVEYDATFATIVYEDGRKDSVMTYKSFDWLNKNHIDYRGLIEKLLALDATNLKIYE